MSTLAPVDYNRLNGLLWRYRPLLDRFEFLLEVQLMVTSSARRDWQHQMADLFEETASSLAALDLEREILLRDGLSLSELASAAPDPWGPMLTEQQAALESTTARIGGLRERNVLAIDDGAAGINKLIDALIEANGTPADTTGPSYGQDGRLRHESGNALLFDGRA